MNTNEEIQVFYSYAIYTDGKMSAFGSGSMFGERGGVWTMIMDNIQSTRQCGINDIHLISFNTL